MMSLYSNKEKDLHIRCKTMRLLKWIFDDNNDILYTALNYRGSRFNNYAYNHVRIPVFSRRGIQGVPKLATILLHKIKVPTFVNDLSVLLTVEPNHDIRISYSFKRNKLLHVPDSSDLLTFKEKFEDNFYDYATWCTCICTVCKYLKCGNCCI